MAELHVETKKHNTSGSMWLWIVLALVIIGALVWYLTSRNKNTNTTPSNNTTGHWLREDSNPFDIGHILDNTTVYLC